MMHDAKELKIAYIGGGSRGWAWGFMTDLAMDPDLCGTLRLYDIDRKAAERNRIIGEKISAHPEAVSRWSFEVSDTLEDALVEAGKIRLRPILMTTLTTILAMVPLGWFSDNKMMSSMAFVIIGGLVASTVLCLLMMPSYYLIISKKDREKKEDKDRKGFFHRRGKDAE